MFSNNWHTVQFGCNKSDRYGVERQNEPAMKTKTPPKMVHNRPLALSIGLVFACAAALTAFEWRTPQSGIDIIVEKEVVELIELEYPPITQTNESKVTPPPPPASNPIQVIPADPIAISSDPVETDVPDFPDAQRPVAPAPPVVYVESEVDDNIPVTFTEFMPKYPGGDAAFFKDLMGDLKYPDLAREMGISGSVYVQFVVEKDGSVNEVSVVRSVHPLLDREAVRAVKTLKRYTPGRQGITPVRVMFTIPVAFRIK